MSRGIPTYSPAGHNVRIPYCTVLIHLSRFSARSRKEILGAVHSARSLGDVITAAHSLDNELWLLRDLVRPTIDLGASLYVSRPVNDISLNQALHLQYTYYSLIIDIHTPITYPWSRSRLALSNNAEFKRSLDKSLCAVADASQAIIMATRHIRIEASCPVL